jgi:hypothetical protein
VDRAAHEGHPHDGPVDQAIRQLVGREALDPIPQADVRGVRCLRLQAHEVLDHGLDGDGRPGEEMCGCERRPVESREGR